MYIKRLIIICVLFIATSTPVHAQELSPALRTSLMQQLQDLLTQVVSLQEQLAELHAAAGVVTHTQKNLYPTDFYDGRYEAVYSVDDLELTPVITAGIRAGDMAVFDTFTKLAGDTFIDTYIKEFRVFNDDDTELGAYVQQKMDRSWILAMNRFDEDLRETHESESVTELLLHEYAHVVFFEDTRVADEFKDEYWDSSRMRKHANKTVGINDVDRLISVNSNFYKQYSDMFVTEYAASSPEEDLVESFNAFVQSDKPTGDSVWKQKVSFFYDQGGMMKLRSQLRNSGVLTLQ